MDLLNIDQEINFLISELNKSLISADKKLELETRLYKLIADRTIMLTTLGKENNYLPKHIDDSSDMDD
jgi:hypothetical protein